MQRTSCPLCERIAVKPMASTAWLVQEPHEGVGIATCGCGRLWLHFWVEIFDDLTAYWAPMSSEDAGSLRRQAEQGRDGEVLSLARRIIKRERTVLMDG